MQAGPPVPELLEVQAGAAIPLTALGNQKLAALGAVDVTAAPFQADPTGGQDSTAAIQRGIFFAREHHEHPRNLNDD